MIALRTENCTGPRAVRYYLDGKRVSVDAWNRAHFWTSSDSHLTRQVGPRWWHSHNLTTTPGVKSQ